MSNKKKKMTGLKVFLTILIVVLIIIGFGIYYLGHSQIEDKFVSKNEINVEEMLNEVLDKSDFWEGKIVFDYDNLNQLLNFFVDFDEIDAISAATIKNGYYSTKENKFVLSLHTYFGDTSLLLDPIVKVEGAIVKLSVKNLSLGKWHIPLPINTEKFDREIQIKESDFFELESVTFTKKGLEFDFGFKMKEIKLLLSTQKDKIEKLLIEYMEILLEML